jgi:hypothetical protein
MIPVLASIATFNAAPNGANLLNLIQTIGAVPAAKKLKYQNALRQLYEGFPNPIYVTANPFALSLGLVNGIGVPRSQAVPSHQVDAILALEELHGIAQGQALLQDICANVGAHGWRVGLRDAVGTASGGNECQVAGGIMPDNYRTPLSVALEAGTAAAGGEIATAMTNLGHAPGPAAYGWLEAQINATPIYRIQGAPSATPSSATHGANWISAAMLQNWVNGVQVFPAPLAAPQSADAVVVLVTVLHGGATNGGGGHSTVRWNASNQSHNYPRPGFISLGHELIHAFHNQLGDQPGGDTNTALGVLFEYLCVGLGPPVFTGATHTENGLRAATGVPNRPAYTP